MRSGQENRPIAENGEDGRTKTTEQNNKTAGRKMEVTALGFQTGERHQTSLASFGAWHLRKVVSFPRKVIHVGKPCLVKWERVRCRTRAINFEYPRSGVLTALAWLVPHKKLRTGCVLLTTQSTALWLVIFSVNTLAITV